MSQTEKPIKLHLGALAVAMLFLWNPFFRMVDVIPDIAGYALLLWATAKIADLSPSMLDARKRFQKLLWLSIAKPVLQLLVILWQARQSITDKGLPVLIILVVSGFELFFFLRAFSELFAGLDFLSMRYDGKAAFVGQKDLKSMTLVTGIVRCGLCVLPELGDLLGGTYSGSLAEDAFDLARYSGMFQLTNLFLGGILGLAWLCMAFPYMRRIAREQDFVARMAEAYRRDVLPNTGLFLRRGVRTAFAMLVLGGICLLDLYIDGIDLIPDFLGSIFLTIGVMLLAKWMPLLPARFAKRGNGKHLALTIGVLSFAVGVAQFVLGIYFADNYYQFVVVSGLTKVTAAKPLYSALVVLDVAQVLCLATLCGMALCGMLYAVSAHTGSGLGDISERAALEETRRKAELKKRLYVLCGGWVAYLLSKLTYGALFCFMPLWWMPHLILGGTALYLLWSRQGELYEQIEYRYL